ncbi:MAG TPA: DUF975 family protein [Thermoguttaceae bacterium]|nr:DUF975 family protein [Thermoguttaceae bacterium]
MPVEFRCTQCNRLLRTQDETAGKKAKCPECGAILTIPTPGSTPEAGTPPPVGSGPSAGKGPQSPFGPIEPPPGGLRSPFGPGAAPDAENPYASPTDYTVGAPAAYAPAAGRIVPTRIDFGDVFSRTWTIFKDRLGISIAVFLVFFALSMGVGIGIGIVRTGVTFALGDPVAGFIIGMFLQVIAWLFNTWLGIGAALCFLKIARGEEVNLGEIFAGGPYLLTVVVASILFGLMLAGVVLVCASVVMVCFLLAGTLGFQQGEPTLMLAVMVGGYLLVIVPVIVLSLMFCMFQYLIIDRNAGIIESLSLSRQITAGNKLTMFGVLLVSGLLGGLLVLFTCGLGFVLVGPYITVLWVVMYLCMSGQPTLAHVQTGPALA